MGYICARMEATIFASFACISKADLRWRRAVDAAEAQDHRFETDPVVTVREDFVACDVLSQLQRVASRWRAIPSIRTNLDFGSDRHASAACVKHIERYIPRECEPPRAFAGWLPLFYHSAMA
jgi:hypothetical protein